MNLAADVQRLLTERRHPAPWAVYIVRTDGSPDGGVWLLDANGGLVLPVGSNVNLAAAIVYAVNVATGTQQLGSAFPPQPVRVKEPDPRY